MSDLITDDLVDPTDSSSTAARLGGTGGGADVDTRATPGPSRALEPLAGSAASPRLALGFIGSGMLAIPVLAGSGAAGLLGKPFGFPLRTRSPRLYGLAALGTLGGTVLTLSHVDRVRLLVISAYINGIAAVPFLILVLLISSSRRIFHGSVNGRLAATLG